MEILITKIRMNETQTPQEILEAVQQRIKKRKEKIKIQNREIQKLKRKIGRTKKLEESILDSFMKLKLNELMNEKENIEKLILLRLCQMTNYQFPHENSEDQIDKAYKCFAKRLAFQIKEKCKIQQESECKKKIQIDNFCYPIQSYYPHEKEEIDDEKSIESDKSSLFKSLSSSSKYSESENVRYSETKENHSEIDSQTRLKIQQECDELNDHLQKDAEINEIKKKNLAEKRAVNAAKRKTDIENDLKKKKKTSKKGENGEDDSNDDDSEDDDEEGGSGGKKSRKNKKRKVKNQGESKATAEQKWEVEFEERKLK